jgi:hypothetical protein
MKAWHKDVLLAVGIIALALTAVTLGRQNKARSADRFACAACAHPQRVFCDCVATRTAENIPLTYFLPVVGQVFFSARQHDAVVRNANRLCTSRTTAFEASVFAIDNRFCREDWSMATRVDAVAFPGTNPQFSPLSGSHYVCHQGRGARGDTRRPARSAPCRATRPALSAERR